MDAQISKGGKPLDKSCRIGFKLPRAFANATLPCATGIQFGDHIGQGGSIYFPYDRQRFTQFRSSRGFNDSHPVIVAHKTLDCRTELPSAIHLIGSRLILVSNSASMRLAASFCALPGALLLSFLCSLPRAPASESPVSRRSQSAAFHRANQLHSFRGSSTG